MIEANPVKYFVARYFFLALCLMQWLIATVIYFSYPATLKNQYTALVFFTLGALLLVVYLIIKEKIRRVAISKKKIVVIEGGKKQKIDWNDVRSLNLVPFLNMYRLKIKGKKKGIYFFPSKNIDPAYGLIGKDTSKMGEILKRLNTD
ncbi:hypothetical protein SanaruYs_23870 [Chryseotalea sanaruensis]|uniref:Uncharacterized protein n=1 Tax=Chryseotalea sanaruensis TaxID=2482724 RepID=A0A401UB92_9BACT|nr:hypothetical protein [Chryseotalea sanaruensis]GCC52151.1 hypothetical protein SanaruYs_23870 [Chryseotalea sanaruensis]